MGFNRTYDVASNKLWDNMNRGVWNLSSLAGTLRVGHDANSVTAPMEGHQGEVLGGRWRG